MISPSMNTIWFWFDEASRRHYHGTPEDVMRKFAVLEAHDCLGDGVEIYLEPSRLPGAKPFDESFLKKYSRLPFKSIHIGDPNPDFLDEEKSYFGLVKLAQVLEDCETNSIIIHAHHFERNRKQRIHTLLSTLSNVNVLIENNGFDNRWGGSIEGLEAIHTDCPDFYFCLDIAHVNDFPDFKMQNYFTHPAITPRIREIHYSYTTSQLDHDPYEVRGFKGYGPFHALFSVLNLAPSSRTLDCVRPFPVVIEGIVPTEDSEMQFLKQEMAMIHETAPVC